MAFSCHRSSGLLDQQKKFWKVTMSCFSLPNFRPIFMSTDWERGLLRFFPNPTHPKSGDPRVTKIYWKVANLWSWKKIACRKFYFCRDNFSESFSSNLDDFFVLSKMFRRFRKSMRIEKNIKKLRPTSSRFIEAIAGIRTRDLLSCFGVEILQSPYRRSEACSGSPS